MEELGRFKLGRDLIGDSAAIRNIIDLIERVANSDCTVLIEGESGTGKELVARRLHARGPRRAQPFIPVNCAGVGEGVFESQFFGHVRGAFTGADQEMLGLVRAADKGTLFLDEVGDIPIGMQAKLLRVLQDGEVLPVGTVQTHTVDTRFIAATNRDIRKDVEEGRFRKDLFYRLNVIRIHIPPLRDRVEDVEPLLRGFLSTFAEHYRQPAKSLDPRVLRMLEQHHWPGNVRELAGWVERLYVTGACPHRLAEELTEYYMDVSAVRDEPPPSRLMALEEAEIWAIRKAMEYSQSNITLAAKLLRIHRTTLWRKLAKYGIS